MENSSNWLYCTKKRGNQREKIIDFTENSWNWLFRVKKISLNSQKIRQTGWTVLRKKNNLWIHGKFVKFAIMKNRMKKKNFKFMKNSWNWLSKKCICWKKLLISRKIRHFGIKEWICIVLVSLTKVLILEV